MLGPHNLPQVRKRTMAPRLRLRQEVFLNRAAGEPGHAALLPQCTQDKALKEPGKQEEFSASLPLQGTEDNPVLACPPCPPLTSNVFLTGPLFCLAGDELGAT